MVAQGFRLGAKVNEKLYIDASDGNTYEATCGYVKWCCRYY